MKPGHPFQRNFRFLLKINSTASQFAYLYFRVCSLIQYVTDSMGVLYLSNCYNNQFKILLYFYLTRCYGFYNYGLVNKFETHFSTEIKHKNKYLLIFTQPNESLIVYNTLPTRFKHMQYQDN